MKDNKKEILPILPILPRVLTMIKQPNRVTGAKFSYNLMQQKVFLYMMKCLQDPINELITDRQKSLSQLGLFKEDHININVPLKSICKTPSEYAEVIETIKDLRKIDIQFPKKDKDGNSYTVYTGLIVEAIVPEKKYKSEIVIRMNRDVCEKLIALEGGYTNFAFEIAFNAKSKYTPRIYQLMSRWKDKGGFVMQLEEFREWLVLGDKYKKYEDLKKKILIPVHDELYKKSDVWFEVDKVMDGKKVKALSFKIITTDKMKMIDTLKDNCIGMMKMHFNMNQDSIDQLRYILEKPNLINEFQMKLQDLHSFINKTAVDNISAYVIKSMQNHFKSRV